MLDRQQGGVVDDRGALAEAGLHEQRADPSGLDQLPQPLPLVSIPRRATGDELGHESSSSEARTVATSRTPEMSSHCHHVPRPIWSDMIAQTRANRASNPRMGASLTGSPPSPSGRSTATRRRQRETGPPRPCPAIGRSPRTRVSPSSLLLLLLIR